MRKIAATYIFTGRHAPIKNGILVSDSDGTIVDLIDNQGVLKEEAGLEFYSGILVPGFVNTHCHLELSYLKGKIEEKAGIGNFLKNINKLRNEETEDCKKAVQFADRKMWASGIAAVGDVSNTDQTINIKLKSKIHYHTFVESFGFHPSRAQKSFDIGNSIHSQFLSKNLSATLVPHSAYSVSKQLFEKIKEKTRAEVHLLSIHNQESQAEFQFYKDGTGVIANHLKNNLKIDISHWKPTGESSIAAILRYLPAENQLLLVHNTFTKEADLSELKKLRSLENTYFVLCPNSNLYIENQIPPVSLFRKENLNISLGTDSLASNHQLSILDEMITLQKHYPELGLEELISWATINGAKALQINSKFGSFEKGKNPGINLLTGIDFERMKLTLKTKVKRLV